MAKDKKPKKPLIGTLPDPFLDKDGNPIPLEMLDEESSDKAFDDVNGMSDDEFDKMMEGTLGKSHRLLRKAGDKLG